MSTTKKHIIAYSLLSAALIITLICLAVTASEKSALANEVNNDYNRAFIEMTDYVDSIETDLRKTMLSGSPSQLASLSNNIFRQSAAAKANLAELPVGGTELDNTAKFLSQVGDYTYVLSQNAINGREITDEDFNNLSQLTEYAASLNESLHKTLEKIYSGEINITSDTGSNTVSAAGDLLSDMKKVEISFAEYPSLIYDGPFSEHIENRISAMTKNTREITQEEAKVKAKSFIGTDKELIFEGETDNTALDAYSFTDNDNSISVSITKRGGYVIYFLNNRNAEQENLDFEKASEKAEEFLKSHGFVSMTSSYYDKASNIATLNYAYTQDGTVCYSDLIKVKVALDNGEIVGFEANGYLMNHEKRKIPEPVLTQKQAQAKVNKHLKVTSTGIALIPKDSMQEVLCYEFRGNFAGRNYIIYINAENGREEKILILLESENGILTQ